MRPHTLGLSFALGALACSDPPSDVTGPDAAPVPEMHVGTSELRFEDIAVGGSSACALTPDGEIDCWRRGSDPEPVSSGQEFFALDGLFGHFCALAEGGRAWCWGENNDGQVGDGTTMDREDPTPVVGGHEFVAIETGRSFTCALDEAGQVWCWGRGSLVVGVEQTSEPRRVTRGRRFEAITAGGSHACVLDGRTAWCWGENGFGQVGDGTTTERNRPRRVRGGRTFTSISGGGSFTCGLEEDGEAFCWGHNELTLELGIDDERTELVTEPAAVVGGHAFTSLSAGSLHACALEENGDAFCWGEGDEGALGDGRGSAIGRPSPVSGGHAFLVIAAGQHSTCALDEDGAPWCWGLIESDGDPLVPTPVLAGTTSETPPAANDLAGAVAGAAN